MGGDHTMICPRCKRGSHGFVTDDDGTLACLRCRPSAQVTPTVTPVPTPPCYSPWPDPRDATIADLRARLAQAEAERDDARALCAQAMAEGLRQCTELRSALACEREAADDLAADRDALRARVAALEAALRTINGYACDCATDERVACTAIAVVCDEALAAGAREEASDGER
jgi:hypothetical protein